MIFSRWSGAEGASAGALARPRTWRHGSQRAAALFACALTAAVAIPFAYLASSSPWAAALLAASFPPLIVAVRSTARGRGEGLLLVLFACIAFNEFLPDILEIPGFRTGPEKVLLLVAFLCLLLRGTLHEEWPLSRHAVTAPALLCCALAFAHTVWSPEPTVAMRKATSLASLALMAHVVAGLSKQCDRRTLLTGLAWILLALGVLSLVLYGLGVNLGGEPAEDGRAVGTLRNPNEWGAFCLAGLPFLFCLGMDERRGGSPRLFLAAGMVLMVSVVLSLSRGAFVAMALVALITLLKAKRRRYIPLTAIGLVLLFAGDALPLERIAQRALTVFNPSADTGSSLTLRADFLQAGLMLFAENPLFGCGIGHFPLQASRVHHVLPGFDAHSTPVTILSEMGISGSLIVAWFVVALFTAISARSKSSRSAELRGVSLGLLALLFMSFSATLYLKSWVWFWVGCAMGLTARREQAE